jgi:hypothetical protein
VIRVGLSISHTPWVPERVQSMARLLDELGLRVEHSMGVWGPLPELLEAVRLETERAPNHVWSERMWRLALEEKVTHCAFLQDDVRVAPNFLRALYAMLEAVPHVVVGLEAVHPAGMSIARTGGRWYTTGDGLIGVGYVFPRPLLEQFLEWRASALKPGALEAITEDTLVDVWAVATGRRIWHPVPTLLDHDTTIASTYGNGEHPYRRPSVTWRDGDVGGWELEGLEHAAGWRPREDVPHLGAFYGHRVSGLALAHVRDFTVAKLKDFDAEACAAAHRRFFR